MALRRRGASTVTPGRPAGPPPRRATPSGGGGGRRRSNFVGDVISELRKVTWPSREEAIRLTGIVLAVSIVIGAFLGGVDYVFYWIINVLLLGKTG